MSFVTNEQELYKLQHYATNEPINFMREYAKLNGRIVQFPQDFIQLLRVRAYLVLGETNRALELLESLKQTMQSQKNNHLLGSFYLIMYSCTVATGGSTLIAEDYYTLAVKYAKLSGSKALACELKNHLCQKLGTELSLETKEEILHAAMQDAIEADILDLLLEVHLTYSILYLLNNLPEPANRELILLNDLVEKEQNPLLYSHILLYFGVVHLMLKNFPLAYEKLVEGISWAETNGFKAMLIPLNINLGICYANSGQAELGIKTYQHSLNLVQEMGLENSQNAHRIQDNLARALSSTGRIEEAVQIMRKSIETAEASGNELRKNIQFVNLADYLIELKAYEEAEQLIEAAIGHFADHKEHHFLTFAYRCKARLYEEQKKYKKGFEALEMLDNYNQIYFRENFGKQNTQYQARIDKLRSEYLRLKDQCITEKDLCQLCASTDFIGEHPSISKALKDALMAARHPFTNVIITGESGTGKEVIARIIHAESNTGKQLIAINASAISPNLIESELFGHKRGAFTGAMEDRKGKFLMANNGTLLLDEISDMPVEAQVKLLRAIETHTVQPVGSDKEIPVHCRIICTSNKDLTNFIHTNKFRLDLYHRLNKVEIHLLPLRERLSDLMLITNFYVERFSKVFRVPKPVLSDSFFERLHSYDFPGNIRELANLLERIFILNPSSTWSAKLLDGMLPEVKNTALSGSKAVSHHLHDAEAQIIRDALISCNWIQKEAAKLLDMSESTLSRHINKLNIRK